jgi:hypothetical protein
MLPMQIAPTGPTLPEAGVMAAKSGDGAGGDAEGAGFAHFDPLNEHPHHTGGAGGEVRDDDGHGGATVRGELGCRR